MTKHSKRSLERREKMRDVIVDEAAQAVIHILEANGCCIGGEYMPKKYIIELIPETIQSLRVDSNGIRTIPTVENREVKVPVYSYYSHHWKLIRERCETYGYFLVWNTNGNNKGLRLGTAEEKEDTQRLLFASLKGFVDSYNDVNDLLEIFGIDKRDLDIIKEQA